MHVEFVRASDYTASRAWDSLLVADFGEISVRLHWTDLPYRWHVNTGPEVFALLDGEVDMHCRGNAGERVYRMKAGDLCAFDEGDEHKAVPVGPARVLVVEYVDSE